MCMSVLVCDIALQNDTDSDKPGGVLHIPITFI